MTKYYVVSGELRVVLLAENPAFAAMDAIQNHADGHTLDKTFVFIDERGFRSDKGAFARYWLTIIEVMEAINGELNAED